MFNFLNHYNEEINSVFLAFSSWFLFFVGADSIPDVNTIKIIVENKQDPNSFLDITEKILSIVSFVCSISVSIFAFYKFAKKSFGKNK